MPRTDVALVANVWTQLGVTGKLIVTISVAAKDGQLRLNEAASDPGALILQNDRFGDQIAQDSDAEDTFAKATTSGWVVTVDQ